MAITIELTPETEFAVRAEAEAAGKDAADVLRKIVEDAFQATRSGSPTAGDERTTLAELYAGRFGRISGSNEPLSENTGQRFSEYVEGKHQAGRL